MRWVLITLLGLVGAVEARSDGLPFALSTLSYGADAAQVLDLYMPTAASDAPVPAVVMAHGGLWGGGERSYLQSSCINIIVESGGSVACATIDYRLSGSLGGVCSAPGAGTYIDQLSDMASAFAFLRSEADTYGLDPAQLYVGGHSAGAHLAHTLNLRWAEFAPPCSRPSGCPAPAGAIGFEGIYDIAAWDAYDASFWDGQYFCATRWAFGAPASSGLACIDAHHGLPCWQVGSPTYLASNDVALGLEPAGDALIIHSPADDWVDISEATRFGAAMSAAFPEKRVITSTDGTCATGSHYSPSTQLSLARCVASFVAPGKFDPIPVPSPPPSNLGLVAIALIAGVRGVRLRWARQKRRLGARSPPSGLDWASHGRDPVQEDHRDQPQGSLRV